MIQSTMTLFLPCSATAAWDAITDLQNTAWRSDLQKTEVQSDTCFVEYTKNGFATHFVTTVFDPPRRWEFDLENKNLRGHWTGVFTPDIKGVALQCTETVHVKRWFLRPFAARYLKQQQARYAADLQKRLGLSQ